LHNRQVISVVIPAHNEARSIGRLLEALVPDGGRALDVVVVANGCTDDTADVARKHAVIVMETPIPSKAAALALGDGRATSYPRLYVDADVLVSRHDVSLLCAALTGDVHAAAPERHVPMDGVSWPVRAYYMFWGRLPAVREELFGRGVIAVDEVGHDRLLPWDASMSDDLRATLSFRKGERVVVREARAIVHPPKTYKDLLARRVRAMAGNLLLTSGAAAPSRRAETSTRDIIGVVIREPRLLPAGAVFVGTAVLAKAAGRRRARRGDTTWLRDESSRS
jgi:glycosyltransferase involved in cell wall biosynthesis